MGACCGKLQPGTEFTTDSKTCSYIDLRAEVGGVPAFSVAASTPDSEGEFRKPPPARSSGQLYQSPKKEKKGFLRAAKRLAKAVRNTCRSKKHDRVRGRAAEGYFPSLLSKNGSGSTCTGSETTSFVSCLSRQSSLSQFFDPDERVAASALASTSEPSHDQHIAHARHCFEGGRMLEAYQTLAEWCQEGCLSVHHLDLSAAELGFELGELLMHCSSIKTMLELQADSEGYTVVKNVNGLKVLRKSVNGRKFQVKAEATLPFPLDHIFASGHEFDLVKSWLQYLKDALLLSQSSIWESRVYAALNMPFPLEPMDTILHCRGYDLALEERCLLVGLESVAAEQLEVEERYRLPMNSGKRKRILVTPGSSIRLEALAPSQDGVARTKLSFLVVVDPQMPAVPGFILDFVLGVVIPYAHGQILQLLASRFADPQDPYSRRMAQWPELYGRIQRAVDEGLAKHYGSRAAAEA